MTIFLQHTTIKSLGPSGVAGTEMPGGGGVLAQNKVHDWSQSPKMSV